ncbi:hypothetical protein A33Q_1671 [Indibacter alkaliphilus LW1]|uniref:Uncharacterized protein n=1 Tax=Indibacter alkaliphilus (strain CCUG 57479 / KCTC 22604 / LW1) TaxID=1189612 RepID=S2DFH1_INDAL|nr:hypothetical protein A33Q_1671 [Indibacter alkaliphilus LW1]
MDLRIGTNSFNRTIQELKFDFQGLDAGNNNTFNRTIQELKFDRNEAN